MCHRELDQRTRWYHEAYQNVNLFSIFEIFVAYLASAYSKAANDQQEENHIRKDKHHSDQVTPYKRMYMHLYECLINGDCIVAVSWSL